MEHNFSSFSASTELPRHKNPWCEVSGCPLPPRPPVDNSGNQATNKWKLYVGNTLETVQWNYVHKRVWNILKWRSLVNLTLLRSQRSWFCGWRVRSDKKNVKVSVLNWKLQDSWSNQGTWRFPCKQYWVATKTLHQSMEEPQIVHCKHQASHCWGNRWQQHVMTAQNAQERAAHEE